MSQLLTPSDAARLLGVTPAAVREMARRGALPVASTTLSGNRLFSKRDVERAARRRATARRGHGPQPRGPASEENRGDD